MSDPGPLGLIKLVYSDHDMAVAEVLLLGESVHVFTGRAKRDPRDPANVGLGEALAIGRALESAGKALLKTAAGAVKHNDDIIAHHALLKERRRVTAKVQGTTTDLNQNRSRQGRKKTKVQNRPDPAA